MNPDKPAFLLAKHPPTQINSAGGYGAEHPPRQLPKIAGDFSAAFTIKTLQGLLAEEQKQHTATLGRSIEKTRAANDFYAAFGTVAYKHIDSVIDPRERERLHDVYLRFANGL